MTRRNIYQGPNSCYARHEGVWVPGSGVTPRTLPSFVALILRDMKRGWSYNENCDVINFTPGHAVDRLNYLIALARAHSGVRAEDIARKTLDEIYREFDLPRVVELEGYSESLEKVARELERDLGVTVAKRVREQREPLGVTR